MSRDEGPFGDHTGYYTLPSPRGITGETRLRAAHGGIPRGKPYPVFHVTAITHRKDAVYPATIVGIPPMEDFYTSRSSSQPVAAMMYQLHKMRGQSV